MRTTRDILVVLSLLGIVAFGGFLVEAQELKRPDSVPADQSDSEAAEPTLPDPFAKHSTPYVSIGFVAFLVAIAAGALYLGRRRQAEPESELMLETDGPRVVMAEPRANRQPPGFYEDLRERETVLEGLEDRSPGRSQPKIIELPVVDHRSVEEEG